ncbi:hypothetical protein LXL04_008361 [Taraxacum kok-saghyz]
MCTNFSRPVPPPSCLTRTLRGEPPAVVNPSRLCQIFKSKGEMNMVDEDDLYSYKRISQFRNLEIRHQKCLGYGMTFGKNDVRCQDVSIGDGNTTSFWEDNWHDIGVLKTAFPRLFAREEDKKVTVKNRILVDMEDWKKTERHPRRERAGGG